MFTFLKRFTFLKAQASSLTASAVDFGTTVIFKEVFKKWYLLASIIGTTAGGITNFTLGRHWVFNAAEKKNKYYQMAKYILVWFGNLLLNTGGVFLVTHYGGVNYIISKIFISLLVGFTYNYILQKKFVFK